MAKRAKGSVLNKRKKNGRSGVVARSVFEILQIMQGDRKLLRLSKEQFDEMERCVWTVAQKDVKSAIYMGSIGAKAPIIQEVVKDEKGWSGRNVRTGELPLVGPSLEDLACTMALPLKSLEDPSSKRSLWISSLPIGRQSVLTLLHLVDGNGHGVTILEEHPSGMNAVVELGSVGSQLAHNLFAITPGRGLLELAEAAAEDVIDWLVEEGYVPEGQDTQIFDQLCIDMEVLAEGVATKLDINMHYAVGEALSMFDQADASCAARLKSEQNKHQAEIGRLEVRAKKERERMQTQIDRLQQRIDEMRRAPLSAQPAPSAAPAGGKEVGLAARLDLLLGTAALSG